MIFRISRLATIVFLAFVIFISNLQAQQKSIDDELYPIVIQKGVDKAIETFHDLKNNASEKYNFNEAELNNLGYRLLAENKSAEAIAILKLNCQIFPKSPNVFDSLGEAYLRLGDVQNSRDNYNKVLVLLESSTINEQLKKFLKQNAQNKLNLLKNPANLIPSTAIKEFIPENIEHPFGKLNPNAPPETEQWGQLVGIWKCTNHALFSGQWISGWPATWAWKYILDGFAVQDIWLQDVKDLPPPSVNLNRHFVGTNIRIFDRVKKKWEAVWFHNGQLPGSSRNAVSNFEAVYENEHIIMTPIQPPAEGQPLSRIVFYNMKKDSFDWSSETSDDGGKSWKATNKISAVRIK